MNNGVVILDIQLLFNVAGLQLCVARRFESLQQHSLQSLYNRPVLEGLQGLSERVLRPLFENYFCTVRPHIHAVSLLKHYTMNSCTVSVLSCLEEHYTQLLFSNNPAISEHVNSVIYLKDLQPTAHPPQLVAVMSVAVQNSLEAQGLRCVHVQFPGEDSIESSVHSISGLAVLEAADHFYLWKNHYLLERPILLTGHIIHGFGRGSTQLGYPTANIDLRECTEHESMVPGVYAAEAWFSGSAERYKAAVNVGWCPYYNNPEKAVEAYIVHEFTEALYERVLHLKIVAYIRAESTFSDLAALVMAISCDVRLTEEIICLSS